MFLRKRVMFTKGLEFVKRENYDVCYHEVTKDEKDTIDAILVEDRNADIILSPTHHIDENGLFHGFRVAYPAHTSNVSLPINREMFFGHTVAEASSTIGINHDVMKLAKNIENCRELMNEFLTEIDIDSRGNEPTLDCMPENVDLLETQELASSKTMHNSEARATDSKPWKPEIPTSIGIYHSFVRGFSKDTREHKIYLSCTGGCTLASESYYNLLLDLGKSIDVDEIVECEETFWLRGASYRARCRLLYLLAKKFGIEIKTITDLKSYDKVPMAMSSTDTIFNNIVRLNSGHIAVFDQCVDSTTSKNGIIHSLHPTEGMWIFKGVHRTSGGMAPLGFGFGNQKTCGIFPHSTFKLTEKNKNKNDNHNTHFTSIIAKNNNTIITYKCDEKNTSQQYTWPDEKYFIELQKCGWDRNNGVVELMPIIVGITRW